VSDDSPFEMPSADGQVSCTMLIFAGGDWVERRHVTFFPLFFCEESSNESTEF